MFVDRIWKSTDFDLNNADIRIILEILDTFILIFACIFDEDTRLVVLNFYHALRWNIHNDQFDLEDDKKPPSYNLFGYLYIYRL